jgi:hypothetical protein
VRFRRILDPGENTYVEINSTFTLNETHKVLVANQSYYFCTAFSNSPTISYHSTNHFTY